MRIILSVLAVLFWGAGIASGEGDGNILVIEVAGEANGIVEIELYEDVAPNHVGRIKELANTGQYDNVVFHRVIDGFMAQSGDVRFGKREGDHAGMPGTGGSDLPNLKAEFSQIPFLKGVVGMARANDPDSANSQFFIMTADGQFLDGQYTVVGRVVSGQEVVNMIRKGPSGNNGMVDDPDYMQRVYLK